MSAQRETSPYAYDDGPRPEVVSFVPVVGRLLDVGCSYGGFGAALKTRSPEMDIWGVEPFGPAAQTARLRLDNVVTGSFPDDVPSNELFDCITFIDVLEHLVDPWGTLKKSREYLRPGGVIVASIPNIRHGVVLYNLVIRGEWRYEERGIMDRTHLRFFTKKSMLELFAHAGLEIDLIAPINVSNGSAKARLLAHSGRYTEQFRAKQFVIRSRP